MDSLIRAMDQRRAQEVLVDEWLAGYGEAHNEVARILAKATSDTTKLAEVRAWLEA